jgi:glycine/D-amino acid oxidase-like deaminating enzyme
VVRRFDADLPEYGRWGIHVLVSQTERGELTLGDTHVYGDAIDPFDDPHLDDLVLDYLKTFLAVPGLRIASRWNGVYVKHPTAQYAAARLGPDVLAVTGVGGAGMTVSFGLAERMANQLLGEGDG